MEIPLATVGLIILTSLNVFAKEYLCNNNLSGLEGHCRSEKKSFAFRQCDSSNFIDIAEKDTSKNPDACSPNPAHPTGYIPHINYEASLSTQNKVVLSWDLGAGSSNANQQNEAKAKLSKKEIESLNKAAIKCKLPDHPEGKIYFYYEMENGNAVDLRFEGPQNLDKVKMCIEKNVPRPRK